MDQVKTGKLIAAMRKQQNLTQEALGQKLGVTNKTVSRWETGAYMPDIDKLLELSSALGISVNELLCGERISDESAFVKQADENLVAALSQDSAFGLQDRIAYFKHKWRREHRWSIGLWAVVYAASMAFALWRGLSDVALVLSLIGVFLSFKTHNEMMAYVEARAFRG